MATPADNLKAIIKDISLRYRIPVITVEHILNYQFGFLRDTIKSGELEAVRIKYLGIIGVKPGRKNYLLENDPRYESKTESEE